MTDQKATQRNRAILWGVISVAAIVSVAVVGVFLVFRYMQDEEGRDLLVWQTQLGIVAESRAAAVNGWLVDQREALERFTALPAVGLYTEQILAGASDAVTSGDIAAIQSYLTTTLRVAAEQAGWAPEADRQGRRPVTQGLAVIALDGRVVASTPGFMPPRFEGDATQGPVIAESTLVGAVPVVVWAAPVTGEQDGKVVATAVAVRPLADVFPLLAQPGDSDQTATTNLIRVGERTFSFLNRPGSSNAGPDGRAAQSYDIATSDLAAAFAARSPGSFGKRRRFDGAESLVTSRAVPALPWVVVRSITVNEALGPARTRRNSVAVVVVLATVTALIGLLLIWRHGASVRITRVAEEQRARADALARKSRFLESIADSQPRAILTVDANGTIRYANRRAGEEVGMTPQSMVGHSLSEVYGRHRALPLADQSRQALEANAPVAATERGEESDNGREILSIHVPLDDGSGDTLILRDDLTELVDERQRREDTLKGVMRTLLTLIDKRDPHAANQSMRAAEVARALAEELDLSEEEVDTVTYAAALMNVGKILVPRDILTRAAPLEAPELVSVKAALAESAALVRDVDFGGPVAETIAHAHMFGEAGDGEAPRIALLGRVAGLANGFVAMTSARAWRGGMTVDAALEELRRRAAGPDDTRLISALSHVLDNKGGRERWAHFADRAKEAE